MTAEQAIKIHILSHALSCEEDLQWHGGELTEANIDEAWSHFDCGSEMQDCIEEFRSGYDEETLIDCESSRHYESKAVAKKLANDQWVGWTFWYGGGKHGEPEAVDWMPDAYFLDVKEEEKLVVVREFAKRA